MAVLVSGFFLLVGFTILTSPNPVIQHSVDDGWHKAAVGWMAFLLGYWVK